MQKSSIFGNHTVYQNVFWNSFLKLCSLCYCSIVLFLLILEHYMPHFLFPKFVSSWLNHAKLKFQDPYVKFQIWRAQDVSMDFCGLTIGILDLSFSPLVNVFHTRNRNNVSKIWLKFDRYISEFFSSWYLQCLYIVFEFFFGKKIAFLVVSHY